MVPLTEAISLTKREDFHPTKADCEFWFNLLNEELFCAELAKPKFVIRRLRGKWGMLDCDLTEGPEDAKLTITTKFPGKMKFVEVLAHEMVHQYQLQFHEPMGHGKHFKKWRPIFEDRGLKLREKL